MIELILIAVCVVAVGASNAFLAHTIIKTMQDKPVIGKGELSVEYPTENTDVTAEANGWLPQDQHYV